MNKVGRSSTEDTANFVASCIKGHLQGVHITSLPSVCKPSLCTISEDWNDDRSDDTSPRNKGETTNSVSQHAEGTKGATGPSSKSVNVNTPMKGGSKEYT